jgi:hypothetical protein
MRYALDAPLRQLDVKIIYNNPVVVYDVFRYIIQVGSYAPERSALFGIQKPNL